jgi:hypothetical protein
MVLSEVFLSFAVSSGIACLLALAQYIFKSKCDTVECCCKLVSIHRRVDLEATQEISQIELPSPLQPKPKPSLDSILRK